MTQDLDAVRRKIRALEAKAEDPASTAAERLSVLARAAHLKTKYGIKDRDPIVPEFIQPRLPKRTAEVGTEPPDFLSKYKPRVHDNFGSSDAAKAEKAPQTRRKG